MGIQEALVIAAIAVAMFSVVAAVVYDYRQTTRYYNQEMDRAEKRYRREEEDKGRGRYPLL